MASIGPQSDGADPTADQELQDPTGEDEEVHPKPVKERAMSSITKLLIQGKIAS